jgi:hypothetical protein
MSQSHTPTLAGDHSEPKKASHTQARTVRELVLALASIEDQMRHLETAPQEERGPDWAASSAAMAELERTIIAALHSHGLPFTPYPYAAEADRPLDPSTPQTAPVRADGVLPEPNRPSPEEEIVAAQQTISHLQCGLQTRTVIGQAQGLLMERHHLNADDAFTRLRICSQFLNRKLRYVATDLAQTGQEPLPDEVLDERAVREQTSGSGHHAGPVAQRPSGRR